jgi:NADH:ubiquinone oxidoreductase subunit F (NADH-binding)
VYEVPFGLSLEEAFADVAGDFSEEPGGFVMGGYFAGLLGERGRSLPLDYDALRSAGSGLGCAAITVLRRDECPVRTAATISAYFAGAGAEQCGVCIKGSAAMRDALERLCDAGSDASEIARLEGWSTSLRGRGACALLDGATTIVATLLREFPDDVAAHLRGACNRCHAISAVQPT